MSLFHQPDPEICRPIRTILVPETGFIVAEINKIDYRYADHPVHFQGRTLYPKKELHITVASDEAASNLQKYIKRAPDNEDRIRDIVDQTDWVFQKRNEYYYVEQEPGVETIIQMVMLPSLKEFFRDLSAVVGKGFVLPPTHVTLYMNGTENGIGLPTREVFDRLVKAAVLPSELGFAASK